jgi:hypothetical protein
VKKIVSTVALSAMLSTSLWVAPSMASDYSAGNQGSGEAPRGLPAVEFSDRAFNPMETPKLDAGEKPRAGVMDEGSAIAAFTTRGMTSDGQEVTVEPSEGLRNIIKQEYSAGNEGKKG